MPASRQRSRSPFMAYAVMAMIGKWLEVFFSFARMAPVSCSPSISGICTSAKARSKSAVSPECPMLRVRCWQWSRGGPGFPEGAQPSVDSQRCPRQPGSANLFGFSRKEWRVTTEEDLRRLHFRAQNVDNGLQQVHLADGLGEVSGYPQFTATGRISALASRGHHDHKCVCRVPDRF